MQPGSISASVGAPGPLSGRHRQTRTSSPSKVATRTVDSGLDGAADTGDRRGSRRRPTHRGAPMPTYAHTLGTGLARFDRQVDGADLNRHGHAASVPQDSLQRQRWSATCAPRPLMFQMPQGASVEPRPLPGRWLWRPKMSGHPLTTLDGRTVDDMVDQPCDELVGNLTDARPAAGTGDMFSTATSEPTTRHQQRTPPRHGNLRPHPRHHRAVPSYATPSRDPKGDRPPPTACPRHPRLTVGLQRIGDRTADRSPVSTARVRGTRPPWASSSSACDGSSVAVRDLLSELLGVLQTGGPQPLQGFTQRTLALFGLVAGGADLTGPSVKRRRTARQARLQCCRARSEPGTTCASASSCCRPSLGTRLLDWRRSTPSP